MKLGIDYEQRPETRMLPGSPYLLAVLTLVSVVWLGLGIDPMEAFARMMAGLFGFCC